MEPVRVRPLSLIAALALLSTPLPAFAQKDTAQKDTEAKVKAHLDAALLLARLHAASDEQKSAQAENQDVSK